MSVLYIEGIANEENINTVMQRTRNVQYYQILDSSYIAQMIADNDNSVFPQVLDTERPDRAAGALAERSVVILVDGSPRALIGPTTLIAFLVRLMITLLIGKCPLFLESFVYLLSVFPYWLHLFMSRSYPIIMY